MEYVLASWLLGSVATIYLTYKSHIRDEELSHDKRKDQGPPISVDWLPN